MRYLHCWIAWITYDVARRDNLVCHSFTRGLYLSLQNISIYFPLKITLVIIYFFTNCNMLSAFVDLIMLYRQVNLYIVIISVTDSLTCYSCDWDAVTSTTDVCRVGGDSPPASSIKPLCATCRRTATYLEGTLRSIILSTFSSFPALAYIGWLYYCRNAPPDTN